MEQISNIASRQVNFKSQTKTQTSPIEAVKEKFNNMEDNEKITVGLSALGVLALATLAIAKRPHKAADIVDDLVNEKPIQNVVQTAQEMASEIIEKPAQKVAEEVIHTTAKEALKYNLVTDAPKMSAKKAFELVDERSGKKAAESAAIFLNNDPEELATNALKNNMGISQVKKHATRNHSHDAKKLIKKQMGEIQQEEVLKQITQGHINSNNVVEVINANNTLGQINQGNFSNISSQEILARMDSAQEVAQNAQKYADEVNEFARQNPTKQNLKKARIAQNQANKAKTEAQQIEKKGLGELMGRGRDELTKPQNISETPKNMLNAETEEQAKTRLSNLIKKKMQHGKMSKKQALELIAKNAKETDLTRKLAQELLETITR